MGIFSENDTGERCGDWIWADIKEKEILELKSEVLELKKEISKLQEELDIEESKTYNETIVF